MQGIEWADVDTDPAPHAVTEVDGECVQNIFHCWPPGVAVLRRILIWLTMSFDADAPIGTLTNTEHARSARLRMQCN